MSVKPKSSKHFRTFILLIFTHLFNNYLSEARTLLGRPEMMKGCLAGLLKRALTLRVQADGNDPTALKTKPGLFAQQKPRDHISWLNVKHSIFLTNQSSRVPCPLGCYLVPLWRPWRAQRHHSLAWPDQLDQGWASHSDLQRLFLPGELSSSVSWLFSSLLNHVCQDNWSLWSLT